jgi:hypothetical protein
MLCAWFDLSAEDRQSVCAWHDREHLGERLSLPGFRLGRRFVALTGSPEYLIIYDVDALTVLASPAYIARLNAPTPWTRDSLGRFRNSIRSVATVDVSRCVGLGGFVLSVRLAAERPAQLLDGLVKILAVIERQPGIVAVRLARCDAALSAVPTEEQKQVPGGVAMAAWIVFVEAIAPAVLDDVRTRYLAGAWLRHHGAADPIARGTYRTQICCLPGAAQ